MKQTTLEKMSVHLDEADASLFSLQQLRERGVAQIAPRYRIGTSESPIERGRRLAFRLTGFQCTSCAKSVKKLFDTYCYPCFQNKAEADRCITSPHLCHYLKGTCREPSWGLSFCYQPHVVYLAHTDKFKVGITRASQLPTRWIDQGATAAKVVAIVNSRHQAGALENFFTKFVSDKSHWSNMLKKGNDSPSEDEFNECYHNLRHTLLSHSDYLEKKLHVAVPAEVSAQGFEILDDARFVQINYPLGDIPEKIVSLNLDKTPQIRGTVQGIKGQYVFFETGVMNIRRHEGYVVEFSNDE